MIHLTQTQHDELLFARAERDRLMSDAKTIKLAHSRVSVRQKRGAA